MEEPKFVGVSSRDCVEQLILRFEVKGVKICLRFANCKTRQLCKTQIERCKLGCPLFFKMSLMDFIMGDMLRLYVKLTQK